MEKQGLVPEDEMAQAALKKAFTMMHEQNSTRDKLACARTILEFTKTKPATKTDVTVKTAEDFLDELANFAEPNDDAKR